MMGCGGAGHMFDDMDDVMLIGDLVMMTCGDDGDGR